MELLRIREVAEAFGMSEQYIRVNDVALGLTPLRTVGRQRRYRAEEVQRALERLEHETRAED